MNIKNKNIIFIMGGVIIIILGYFIFNYFFSSVSEEKKDTIYDESSNEILPSDSDYEPYSRVTKEQSLAKFQELSQYKNLSDFKGNEIYDLIQILEQLRLDIDFFSSASFKNLIDYTREVTVSEEEKGNTNPFIPVRGAAQKK